MISVEQRIGSGEKEEDRATAVGAEEWRKEQVTCVGNDMDTYECRGEGI